MALPVDHAPAAPRETPTSAWPRVLAGVLVLLLAALLFTAFSYSSNPAADVPAGHATPRRVVAPGLVESESGLLKLAFEVPGKLRCVNVEEGKPVAAGQIIAELENDDVVAKFDLAAAAVRVAEAQLVTLKGELDAECVRCERTADRYRAELALLRAGPRSEEIARARADVAALEADSRRAAEDAAKYADASGIQSGAWSAQQRDSAKRLAEVAAARLAASRETLLALERGYRKEDIDRAAAMLAGAENEVSRCKATQESRLDTARAQIAEAQARLKLTESERRKMVLRSPLAGVVLWKYHHSGESVGVLPPDPVAAIADPRRLRVRASVDEADFAFVKTGQRVFVTCDSLPGRKFKGRVGTISDTAGEKRFSTGEASERADVNVVETLISFDEPAPLKLGVRVTVSFELDGSSR